MARPSEFTTEKAEAICLLLAEGQSLRKICANEGMPDKATIFRWLAAFPQFCDQYAHAREAQTEFMAEELLEIADDAQSDFDEDGRANSELVARAKLRVDTRKWLLSKMAPKKYGDKIAVGGADDLPAIQAKVSVEFVSKKASLPASNVANVTGIAGLYETSPKITVQTVS